MTFSLRPARADDIPSIVPWTADTFDWGDYVPERLPDWIEDEDSEVMVCSDEEDIPVALAHVVMLSPSEGWLEAARVHPAHKRSRLGSTLNRAGVTWARQRGARVVRLATEEDNHPARSQVESLGYRKTSSWVFAQVGQEVDPVCSEGQRLRPAPAPDVDAAWMFWSTTELYHAGRGLIALRWQWRKARPGDLADAAAAGRLYQSPAGWLITNETGGRDMWVGWVATTREEAPVMLEGVLDLGRRRDVGEMSVVVPDVPWAGEALTRAGATTSRVLVYSLPL